MANEEQEKTMLHQAMLDLAGRAIKFITDDKEVNSFLQGENLDLGKGQFGNNFFLLFVARKRKLINPDDSLVRIYLTKAEGITTWNLFISENEKLLEDIDQTIQEMRPYHDLMRYYRDLHRDKRYTEADELDSATKHPLGITAIGNVWWYILNPKLHKAAEEMQKRGIDPSQFFG